MKLLTIHCLIIERLSNDSYEFRTKVIFGTEIKNIGAHCAHELLFYLLRLSTRKCNNNNNNFICTQN